MKGTVTLSLSTYCTLYPCLCQQVLSPHPIPYTAMPVPAGAISPTYPTLPYPPMPVPVGAISPPYLTQPCLYQQVLSPHPTLLPMPVPVGAISPPYLTQPCLYQQVLSPHPTLLTHACTSRRYLPCKDLQCFLLFVFYWHPQCNFSSVQACRVCMGSIGTLSSNHLMRESQENITKYNTKNDRSWISLPLFILPRCTFRCKLLFSHEAQDWNVSNNF